MAPGLTINRLRELLDCNPDTGVLTWRIARGRTAKSGDRAGNRGKDGYVRVLIDHKSYLRHRLIWFHIHGKWPAGQLDHINNRPGDDWLSNLRPATHGQNRANSRAANKHGFKGISFHPRGKNWRASIVHNKQQTYLGSFATPEEAHEAYKKAARLLHGEFANGGEKCEILL